MSESRWNRRISMQEAKEFASEWGRSALQFLSPFVYVAAVNDFTRPPIPDPHKPQDFKTQLDRIDPSKPIGLFVFNVLHHDFTNYGVNAVRNNYIELLKEQYGENVIVVDNPTATHLQQFTNEFNARFGAAPPVIHTVANHHQNTYRDEDLAAFLASLKGVNKRAVIYSCGPVSKAYEKADHDYVIIPVPDGVGNVPELDLEGMIGYKKAIRWMAALDDPEAVRHKFAERTVDNMLQEAMLNIGGWQNQLLGSGNEYHAPVVVTRSTESPQTGR